MFDATYSSIQYQPATDRAQGPAAPGLHQDHLIGGPLLTFRARQSVFSAGDRSGPLYQVAFGMVQSYRILADGHRQICAFHLPGEVFGLECDGERHFFADTITRTGLHALRPNSSVEPAEEILSLALASLGWAHDHILTLSYQGAVERVAAFLLEMAERQHASGDGIVDLPMTRSDIGDYLGLTIETISRALTKLRKRGIIRIPDARQVDILRWETLRTCCQ